MYGPEVVPGKIVSKLRHVKKRVFLKAFVEAGTLLGAERLSKISRDHHYYEWRHDPEYMAAFEDAKEQAIQRLETALRKRAIERSDTAAIFLLKAARPEIYRDVILGQNNMPPVNVNVGLLIGFPKSPDAKPRELPAAPGMFPANVASSIKMVENPANAGELPPAGLSAKGRRRPATRKARRRRKHPA